MKEGIKFISKVTVIHVLTYIACGILFMTVFGYQASLKVTEGMRDTGDIIVGLAPVFQIVRGLLFGVALWFIKDAFVGKKLGWLVLWAIILILGIFNTPSTAPGSIEELIYHEPSYLSWNLQLGGMMEILTQTLLFSVFVFLFTKKRSDKRCPE